MELLLRRTLIQLDGDRLYLSVEYFEMEEENILPNRVLITVYDELIKSKNLVVASKIQAILQTKKLPKPNKHNKKEDETTSYYKVQLCQNEIEIIQDLFYQLEVNNISVDGDTAPLASFYGDIADTWGKINPID